MKKQNNKDDKVIVEDSLELDEEDLDNDNNETISAKDAVNVVKNIAKGYKNSYNHASTRDKIKILLIFLPLCFTFVLGMVGILLANIGKYYQGMLSVVGYVFMGVGLGGFFLIIVSLIIISVIKNK